MTEAAPAQSPNENASRRPALRRLARVSIALMVLALGWTVGLGWLLPRWAQPHLEKQASQALGTPVHMSRLEVSPWRLAARVQDLSIGPADAPWLTLAAADVDLSIESLWRLAPVLDSLTLQSPRLRIERVSAQQLNVSPLIERLRSQPPSEGEPARFSLNNIRLKDGALDYLDRVLKQEHRVSELQVGIPFISNLPSKVAIDVQPQLEARIDGSPLRLSGRSRPFARGRHSELQWQWSGISIEQWANALRPLLPEDLRADVRAGQLSASGRVVFEEGAGGAGNRLQVQARAELSGVQADLPAWGVQTRFARLSVEGVDVLPLQRELNVQRLSLAGWQVDAALDPPAARASGRRAEPKAEAASPTASSVLPSAPATAAPAWRWRVARIDLDAERLALHPHKETPATTLPVLGPVKLKVERLDSRPGTPPAALDLQLADSLGGKLQASAELEPDARRVKARLQADALQPQPWLTPWQQTLPLRLARGQASLRLELAATPAALSWSAGSLQLDDVRLQPHGSSEDRLGWKRVALEGLEGELGLGVNGAALKRAAARRLAVQALDLKASRDADGQLPLLPQATAARAAGAGPAASAAASPSAAPTPPAPRLELAELHCDDCRAELSDHAVEPAAQWQLNQARLRLRGLSSDLRRRIAFDLDTRAQQDGRVSLSGNLQPAPLELQGKVGVKALDLRVLQPYLAPYLNVSIATARAEVDATVQAHAPRAAAGPAGEAASAPALDWQLRGRLALTDLSAQDRVSQTDFLRWRELSLNGADIRSQGEQLHADLGRIELRDFYGRLIINARGELNLRDIVRRQGETGPRSITSADAASAPAGSGSASTALPSAPPVQTASTGATPASATSSAAPPAAPRDLRWRSVRLLNGRVDFTDNFIRPNYSARLTDVSGEVSAVAAFDPRPATVRIAGRVDAGAPLSIEGELHPLGPRLYTDIKGSAKGIELTRLTPYAARYAGYAIEKGTLSMTVQYKVADGKLEAQNQVFLDQLTFGEKVDSPDATRLPVQFAVSLLKNSRGEIDVNLPISGTLDDPQFSVGGLIWRVVLNLVAKAVTSPFNLLAGAFGSPDQELGYIEFDAGSTELDETARKKLDTLAKALADRPALKLEATGRADPAVDTEGLRRNWLQRLLRAAKARATGESPVNLAIGPEERLRWLEAAYKAAEIKKPRNLLGIPKTLPPAEMEALLLATAPAGDEALRSLANHRADRIKAYLTEKLAPERVLLTASKLDASGIEDKGRTTRVQFNLR